MTRTDYRQFMDEVKMIRERKEFSGTFTTAIKNTMSLKNVDEMLATKRKAYDHLLANVLRKYRIVPDDLYNDLDQLWADATVSPLEGTAGKALRALQFGLGGKLAGDFAQLRKAWTTYTISTIELADSIAKAHVKDG